MNNSKEKVLTMPETLGVSNAAQKKDSRLNEKSICPQYSSGPFLILNTDTPLNQSTVLSTGDNVARLQIQEQGMKALMNKKRRVSFSHELAATVIYSETKNNQSTSRWQRCKDFMLSLFTGVDFHQNQWKRFMLLLLDPTRNLGIGKTSIEMLWRICNDCRDAGLGFSFEAIEGHARFRQAVSRHVLVKLFNEAGYNVSVSSPLELPGGDYSYHGDDAIAAPASLRHDTIYTTDKVRVNDEALGFGGNWELFYECCSDSDEVSEGQLDELTDLESDYTMRYGLVDCDREYVQHFCEQASWPQQLIDDILDSYYNALDDENEFLNPITDDDDTLDTPADYQLEPDNVTTHDHLDDETFESLAAESASLNTTCGTLKFSAAARLLHQNSLVRRVTCPEPSLVKPKAVVSIDDSRPLGFEWQLDDQNRRVRRSLRLRYRKEWTEAPSN